MRVRVSLSAKGAKLEKVSKDFSVHLIKSCFDSAWLCSRSSRRLWDNQVSNVVVLSMPAPPSTHHHQLKWKFGKKKIRSLMDTMTDLGHFILHIFAYYPHLSCSLHRTENNTHTVDKRQMKHMNRDKLYWSTKWIKNLEGWKSVDI